MSSILIPFCIKREGLFMMPDYKTIGLRLAQARKAANFKQKDMAALVGATVGYATSIENGKKPSIEYIMAAADACGVSIDWLLTGKSAVSNIYEQENSDIEQDLREIAAIFSELEASNRALLLGMVKTVLQNTAITREKTFTALDTVINENQKREIT
jgi:transcriptional regulator with XRE-family HTH domain